SRIGRRPIKLTDKVKVAVTGPSVVVEGPLGKLEALIPAGVSLKIESGVVNVVAPRATRNNRGFQGLMRALLANMVTGVVTGYKRSLEITGVGYKAELKGDELVISAGYSHVVRLHMPKGVKAVVDKSQTKVSLESIDKALVGLMAAKIRAVKEPEPYKGKGIKYAGEAIRRKVGKTGAK
ncbi:MAG: 50S ribosomal protein L6, partial [Deltaproteobacteria bacterium]